jgi:hypothetical protein
LRGGGDYEKHFLQGYSEKKIPALTNWEKISCPSIWWEKMLQISMVAGIDLTSPRRSAGLSVRLIYCWKTPQNAGNSLSELQEIKNFLPLFHAPPDPSRCLHLRLSTQLSQSPSYGLICCRMTYTYYHIVHGDGIGKKIFHITIPEKNFLPAVNHLPPPPQKLNGQRLTLVKKCLETNCSN